MLLRRSIEAAQTKRGAPVAFASKKDGSLPFCVDYRKLSSVTKLDSYTVPRIDGCIDSLGKTAVHSTSVANSGI